MHSDSAPPESPPPAGHLSHLPQPVPSAPPGCVCGRCLHAGPLRDLRPHLPRQQHRQPLRARPLGGHHRPVQQHPADAFRWVDLKKKSVVLHCSLWAPVSGPCPAHWFTLWLSLGLACTHVMSSVRKLEHSMLQPQSGVCAACTKLWSAEPSTPDSGFLNTNITDVVNPAPPCTAQQLLPCMYASACLTSMLPCCPVPAPVWWELSRPAPGNPTSATAVATAWRCCLQAPV